MHETFSYPKWCFLLGFFSEQRWNKTELGKTIGFSDVFVSDGQIRWFGDKHSSMCRKYQNSESPDTRNHIFSIIKTFFRKIIVLPSSVLVYLYVEKNPEQKSSLVLVKVRAQLFNTNFWRSQNQTVPCINHSSSQREIIMCITRPRKARINVHHSISTIKV